MRRRSAFRSHSLARLLLCIILLVQSSSISAVPVRLHDDVGRAMPGVAANASPAVTGPYRPTTSPANAPAAICAPNRCSSYLPLLVAGTPPTPTQPTTTPTQPTQPPTTTPQPTQPPTQTTQPTPTATQTTQPTPTATQTTQPTPTVTQPTQTPTPTQPAQTPTPASDTEPPTAPTNLRETSKTTTSASLAWDAATDNVAVVEYALYTSATLVLTTTDLSADIVDLSASTTYTFTVSARDAAGNLSSASVPLALTTAALANPFADSYEPDDSAAAARPIAPAAIQQHAFSVPSDQDWVAFSATAGQTYQVDTINLAPGVDTYLELYDLDGTTLLAEDDDSNGDHGSWIEQPIAATGTYYIKVRPTDSASAAPGHTYDLRLILMDTEPPGAPGNLRALGTTNTTITLGWDAATDNVGVNYYIVYRDSFWVASTLATTTTVTGLSASETYSFRVEAIDWGWNSSGLSEALEVTTALPPDPAAIAPPVDQTIASEIAQNTAFLYSGSNPIQTGVGPDVIEPERVAIVRGRAITRDGAPLAGVQISVLGHSEYGRTASRADGAFDLAVNGGGALTIEYRKDGYLPAQRQVTTPWRDYISLPDVALVPLDPIVTEISLDGASPLQSAAGSVVSDTDGMRQALLVFPANLTAMLELPNGAEQALTTLHVRATEYTVGERGPAAMPGSLPLASAYTYAVDYSVDEALAAGARHVRFSQPVVGYVENFLGFPVGEAVPAGYYDRERAVWVASDNGRIVKIIGVTDGLADLDLDGGGEASDPGLLGISDAERAQLAGRYAVGQELWRVPVPHFSAWDFNWPFSPPWDAILANGGDPTTENPAENPCQREGSIIECQNQLLGEQFAITGTPYQLHYTSERVADHAAYNAVRIPLSGPSVPNSLARIEIEVEVAGQHFSQSFSNAPNQSYFFIWDKNDAYGRRLQGQHPVTARIGFVYPGSYRRTARFGYFGNGTPITGDRAREEVTLWKNWSGTVGAIEVQQRGLGGWALDIQHAYDPAGQAIYLGSGGRQGAQLLGPVIANPEIGDRLERMSVAPDGQVYYADSSNQTIWRVIPSPIPNDPQQFYNIAVAGSGLDRPNQGGFSGDGGYALNARLNSPSDVAFGPDGSMYIADYGNRRIRRVDPNGMISTFAGGGSSFDDGALATDRYLSGPTGVAVGPDGTVYIADRDASYIYRVAPDGRMTRVAGYYQGFSGDGNYAIYAALNHPSDIALAPDGSLYIADTDNNRIRHVNLLGVIKTFAGRGASGLVNSNANGDGGPATNALINGPTALAVAPDGSLYIGEARRVRWVGPDRIIATVVGHPTNQGAYPGDGTPVLQTGLYATRGIALGPDGTLFISSNYLAPGGMTGPRILRTQTTMPGFAHHDIAILSTDGAQLFQFDASGRHLRTLDTLTGVALYTFAYDAAGRLASVADRDGLLTWVERDAAGAPTAIVSPYGQRTSLTLNADGYLSTITNPAGELTAFGYTSGGLLTSLTDPRGGVHSFEYDQVGRLTRDTNPVGGFTALARAENEHGYTVTLTNALGDTSSLTEETLPTGEQRRVNIAPNGAVTSSIVRPGGIRESTDARGNVTTITQGPDPRFGWATPYVTSITIKTAAGQTYFTQTTSRSAALFDPLNPLSLKTHTTVVTTNGNRTTTVYDGLAHTITSTDAAGKQTVISFDALGRMVGEQITNLAPRLYVYDGDGRLATVSEGSGADTRTTVVAYNPNGRPASSTDPLGGTTAFVYDAAGRVTRQTLPTGHALFFAYDAAGNCVSATDAQGIRTSFEYDLQNRLIAQTRDPEGRAVRSEYTYDAADNLLARVDDAGAGRLNVANQYVYTPIGSGYAVSSVTDALGQRAEIAYTPSGELHSATDPLGHTSVMTYTAQGWLAEVASPGGRVVRTTYDQLGRPVSVIDPRGGTTVSTYDALGRLRSITAGAASVDGQPAQNQTITYAYDLNSRVVGVTDPAGQTSTRAYDLFGRPASASDSLGHATTIAYDALDRVVLKTVGANVPGEALRTAYSYDASGRPLSQRVDPDGLNLLTQYRYTRAGSADTWSLQELVDPKGNVSAFHFNSLGQRDQSIDARGQIWSFANDNLGRLNSQTDPLGRVTSYQLDPLGRVLALTEAGRTERWSYRADGILSSRTDFAGRTTSYSYDADRRVIGVDYPAGTPDVTYAYDRAGNLTAMTDGLGGTSYAYDALNRLRERTRDGRTVGYRYDANSLTAQIDYWGQGTVDYSYDAAGRMTSLTPWGAAPTTYAYSGIGLLAEQTRDNGVTSSYGYDSAGRLVSMLHAAGATALDSIQYALDANGNRTQITDGDGATSFGYDELNRLISASYPAIPGGPVASSVPYSLDATGNRLGDGATSFSYDAGGRIANPGYSYDDNGNLLGDGTASYSYDAANRLIESVKGGVTTSYGYDGKGNLIRETVGGVTTDFVLDERGGLPLILGEVRSDGTELRYAYGVEGVSAQQTISNTTTAISYPLLDALGSVRRLTDASGVVTLARSYDAFGNIRHSAGLGWTPLGFTGERMGTADGTLYLRARHYSPALGRFLQRDSYAGTLDRPQSLNRYAYTENNPATLSDPSGHCPLCVSVAVGAAVGAGFEYGSQVYQNYQNGMSGWDAWRKVRGDKIAVAAVQGGVAGGIGFFAGPLVAGAAKLGKVASIAAGAIEGMISDGVGQIAANLLQRCDWDSNLLQSMLGGGLAGGFGAAIGWAAKQAKATVSKGLGGISDDAIALVDDATAALGPKQIDDVDLVNRRRMPSSDEALVNGAQLGEPLSPQASEEARYAAQNLAGELGRPKVLIVDKVMIITRPLVSDGSSTVFTPSKELVDRHADDWLDGLEKVRQAVIAAAQRDGYNVSVN